MTVAPDDQPAPSRGYDLRMLWRLLQYLRPHRLTVAAALAAMVLGSVAELAQPWIMQQAIDRHFPSGDVAGLGRLCLLFLGSLLSSGSSPSTCRPCCCSRPGSASCTRCAERSMRSSSVSICGSTIGIRSGG